MKKNILKITKNKFFKKKYYNKEYSKKSHAINPRKTSMAFLLKILSTKILSINKILLILLIISFSFFIYNINATDFLPVNLEPKNATTLDNLICSWNTTGNPKVNVTWYNGSNIYLEIKETTSIQVLNSLIAKKGQTWNCSVVESNNSLNIGSDNIIIVNSPPYAPNVENATIQENSEYSKNISTYDPDNDPIDSYMCFPNYFSINNGIISWTPSSSDVEPEKSKLYNFTCIVFDSEFDSNSKKFSLNVTARNDPPYFSPNLVDITKTEGQKVQYLITASDEETPNSLFNLSFNYLNCSYDAFSVYEINRTNNNSFIFQVINNNTLSINEVGNCTINLTLIDPINNSINTSGLFKIEVLSTNHPPNINYIESKDRYYNQSENFQLLVNATDIDENEILTFLILTPTCDINPWNLTILNNSNNASALIKATPLNESHIKCKTINIKVIDSKNSYTNQTITLNVSNVNDGPVIDELSYHINNSFSNTNLSNLSLFAYVNFRYYINAKDNDILYGTDETDFLTFNSNASLCIDCPIFTLNQYTGEINFTPNENYIGKTYTYKINVTDKYGLFDEKTLKISILNNSIPFFNQTPPDIYAKEDELYTLKINATDIDDGNVSFYINTSLFNISNTGLINFTPSCYDVGNYSVLIRISDSYGAENSTIIKVNINISPDIPIINTIQNITLFEEDLYSIEISAVDDDLLCNQEDNLNFSYEFLNGSESSFTGFSLYNYNSSSNYRALISFYTNQGSQGNYLINFSVIDLYNLKSSFLWNLTIINRSQPPVINNITPYGSPYTNFSTGWRYTSNFPGYYTKINISEGMTIIFDHNSSDPDNDEINFTWLMDNEIISNEKNLSINFTYDSNKNYNLTLIVSDIINNRIANNVSFSWNISVRNINRMPILNKSLNNITVNKTANLPNYFICNDILPGPICDGPRFYDPDNDNLIYSHTNASKVSISISGDSLSLTGLELGSETIVFYASDGEYIIESNNVTINVIELPEKEQTTTSSTSSSSSSSTNSNSYIPYSVIQEVEKEKKIYLDIIAPEELVIYQNNTIRQLINIINNGNITLRGITLSALTNSTTSKLEFSNFYIPEIKPKDIVKTDLIIYDYKLMNHYEVIINANISDPKYTDKAIIYVNAIEKSKGNQSVTATKITFANDLLSSNPECIELNEYLKKAKNLMENREYLEAENIIDSVIQGCKYLVSQNKIKDESPKGLFFNIKLDQYTKIALIVTLIIIILIILLTLKLKKTNQEQEQE